MGMFYGGVGVAPHTRPLILADDEGIFLGADSDVAIILRAASAAADEEITSIIEGASDHQGFAANSLVISNITNDGDIIMLVSDGGNSLEFLLADADVAKLSLGWGMTTLEVALGGSSRLLYTAAAFAFQEATTISSTGILSIDAVGVIVINAAGGNIDYQLKSANNDTMVIVDAALDNIAIGGGVHASAFLTIVPGAQSRSLQTGVGWGFNLIADTIDATNSDTDGVGAYMFIGIPTLTGPTTYTATIGATVYIQGAPVAGAGAAIGTAYSLWVDDGDIRLDGAVLSNAGAQTVIDASGNLASANGVASFSGAITNLTVANGIVTAAS